MKSFKEILREQEGGRKEFRDLLKSGQIDIKIEQQPTDPTKPKTSRRKRNVGQGKPTQTTTQQPASAKPELTKQQQSAINKGYRTPEGNISQRGVETYATRRGTMGYGDPGKDPSKYGVDPRQVSADARQRTTSAAAGDKAARSSIKADVKKIEARYPAPKPATGSQSSFSQFSRRASSITSDIKTGRANIPTPEMSAKDTKFFRGLEADPVKRTAAKIDAAIGQQADDLMGKKGPQAPTGYSKKGLADLSKAIDDLDKPQVKTPQPSKPTASSVAPRRGQGSRVVGSRVARGGAPQAGTRQTAAMLDALRDMGTTKPKPQVTYGGGRGKAAVATPKPQPVATPTSVNKPQTPVQPQAPKPQFKTTQVKLPEPPKSSSPSVAPEKASAKPKVTVNDTPTPTGRQSAQRRALDAIDDMQATRTTAGRLNKGLGGIGRGIVSGTKGAVKRGIAPAAVGALDAYSDITDPNIKASPQRAVTKQATSGLLGWRVGTTAAKLMPGNPLMKAGAGIVAGTAAQLAGQQLFDKLAGQTPTQKAAAAKAYRQSQGFQKGEWADKPGMGFDTRPLQTVIKDPKTGKETVGYLTKQTIPDTPTSKGGVATGYKAADTSNAARAASTSNWLERIGRTINPGAYEKSDAEEMRKRVARIKKLQGLPEGRTPMKTYAQFMEQAQSQRSKDAENLVYRGVQAAQKYGGRLARGLWHHGSKAAVAGAEYAHGAIKGYTKTDREPDGIDLVKMGQEFNNVVIQPTIDTAKRFGRNISQTDIRLNPPGSGYPPNLRRGR